MNSQIFSLKSLRSCVSIITKVKASPPSILQHIINLIIKRLKIEVTKAQKALLNAIRATKALEAIEFIKATYHIEAAKPLNIKRAQDELRRLLRIKTLLKSKRKVE